MIKYIIAFITNLFRSNCRKDESVKSLKNIEIYGNAIDWDLAPHYRTNTLFVPYTAQLCSTNNSPKRAILDVALHEFYINNHFYTLGVYIENFKDWLHANSVAIFDIIKPSKQNIVILTDDIFLKPKLLLLYLGFMDVAAFNFVLKLTNDIDVPSSGLFDDGVWSKEDSSVDDMLSEYTPVTTDYLIERVIDRNEVKLGSSIIRKVINEQHKPHDVTSRF